MTKSWWELKIYVRPLTYASGAIVTQQNLKTPFCFRSALFYYTDSIDISRNRFHGQLGNNFVNLTLLGKPTPFFPVIVGPRELGLNIALKYHTENAALSRNMLSGSLPPELFQISNLSEWHQN